LWLNQEPMVLSPTELTLNVLPSIARACPKLVLLALYVDTNIEPLETSSLSTFTNLKSISLGISPLQSRHVVLTMLAQVLPEGYQLTSNPSFEPDVEKLGRRVARSGLRFRNGYLYCCTFVVNPWRGQSGAISVM